MMRWVWPCSALTVSPIAPPIAPPLASVSEHQSGLLSCDCKSVAYGHTILHILHPAAKLDTGVPGVCFDGDGVCWCECDVWIITICEYPLRFSTI